MPIEGIPTPKELADLLSSATPEARTRAGWVEMQAECPPAIDPCSNEIWIQYIPGPYTRFTFVGEHKNERKSNGYF